MGFEVDASTFGFADHTRYISHGTVFSASGGLSYRVSSRITLGVDAFYAPLWVRRGAGQPLQEDGLFNVRALVKVPDTVAGRDGRVRSRHPLVSPETWRVCVARLHTPGVTWRVFDAGVLYCTDTRLEEPYARWCR